MRRVVVNTWATWRRRWRAEQPSGVLADQRAQGDMAVDLATRLAVRTLLGSGMDAPTRGCPPRRGRSLQTSLEPSR